MPSLNTGNAILSNAIAVDSSYNVGIGGAASGSFKLQVTGNGIFNNSSSMALQVNGGTFTQATASSYSLGIGNTGGFDLTLGTSSAAGVIQTWSSKTLSLNPQGNNVGIGSGVPNAKLSVTQTSSNFILDLVNGSEGTFALRTYNHGTGSGAGLAFTQGLYYETTENSSVRFYRGPFSSDGYLALATTATNRLIISNTGIITAPSQVSFKAYISGANPELTKGVTSTIPYNNEEYDIQGNFNTSTYKFTAPVAGRYLFIVNINFYGVDDTSYILFRLVINSSVARNLFTMANMPTGNTGDTNLSGSDILNLAAGDTVEARIATDGSGSFYMSAGLTYNTFSGHLLG
jgi:hypothetical protein